MRKEGEVESCLEVKIQRDFSSNALAFLFHLNDLLDNRLREVGFNFFKKLSRHFIALYPLLKLKLFNKYISLEATFVIYYPSSPPPITLDENWLRLFLCHLSNT